MLVFCFSELGTNLGQSSAEKNRNDRKEGPLISISVIVAVAGPGAAAVSTAADLVMKI